MKTSPNLDYIKYLGVNYKYNGNSILEGFDCINLCCAIAKDRGIYLPNINHTDFNINNYGLRMKEVKDTPNIWKKVAPQENALVLFKIHGVIKHVGYMIDKYSFIHITEGSKVTVERLTSPQWNKRIEGFYVYIGDADNI